MSYPSNHQSVNNQANQLKALFNLAWDDALQRNNGVLSYRDMVRISDAMKRSACPKVLGTYAVPKEIEAGLIMACAVVDPNEVRLTENLKAIWAVITSGGGLGILAWGIFTLLNPGVLAAVSAIFFGGIAGGPIAFAAIPAGIAIAVGALYVTLQNMTPQERATKAHNYVMEG